MDIFSINALHPQNLAKSAIINIKEATARNYYISNAYFHSVEIPKLPIMVERKCQLLDYE